MSKPKTVRAVVEYAAQLRREAELEIASDPFASPYLPTEAGARKLSNRLGPEAAIDHLRRRAAMHKRDAREHGVIAQKSLDKHAQRTKKFRQQRNRQRDHLSLGKRIDGAIGRLSLVAAPAAAQTGEGVHGGTPDYAPTFAVDAADKARRIALKAVREIEDIEDDLRLRDVQKAAA